MPPPPGFILHHHARSKLVAESIGHKARSGVGHSASAKGNNKPDGLNGVSCLTPYRTEPRNG
jgi:hypothetical protein